MSAGNKVGGRHYHKWGVISEAWLHCMGCDKWRSVTNQGGSK